MSHETNEPTTMYMYKSNFGMSLPQGGPKRVSNIIFVFRFGVLDSGSMKFQSLSPTMEILVTKDGGGVCCAPLVTCKGLKDSCGQHGQRELICYGAGTTCTDVSTIGCQAGLLGNSSRTLAIWLSEILHGEPHVVLHECTGKFMRSLFERYLIQYQVYTLQRPEAGGSLPASGRVAALAK